MSPPRRSSISFFLSKIEKKGREENWQGGGVSGTIEESGNRENPRGSASPAAGRNVTT